MFHFCQDEAAALMALVPGLSWFCFKCRQFYNRVVNRRHDCDHGHDDV